MDNPTTIMDVLAVTLPVLAGAAGPVLIMYLQSRTQRKDTLWRTALESARYDHKTWVDAVKTMSFSTSVP